MRPGKPGRFALGRCRSFQESVGFLWSASPLGRVAPLGTLRFPSLRSFGYASLSVALLLPGILRFPLERCFAPLGRCRSFWTLTLSVTAFLSGRLRLAVALLLPGISWSSVSVGIRRLRVPARGTPYGAHPCVRVPLKQPSGIPTCERCACVFP